MNSKETRSERHADPGSLEELSAAIESGAGMPAVARAAGRALGASVALIDRASNVLAVAAASPDEERKLLAGGAGVGTVELRVADTAVGELRWRPREEDEPDAALLRMVSTLVGLELERSRSPEWATEEAAGDFVRDLLERKITDRGDIEARAAELGTDLAGGAGVLIARAVPHVAQTGEWRTRVLAIALRAVRAVSPGALAAEGNQEGEGAEVVAVVPADPKSGSSGPPMHSPTSSTRASSASRSASLAAGLLRIPSTSTAPVRRPSWPRTWGRPRGRGYSPSRTPAPTGCSCPP